jgi:hypothetical protein
LSEAQNGVQAGAALELKVLEGQAQLAEARHQLRSLEDTISDMKVEFNDLTGLPLDADIEPVAPAEETSDATAGDSEQWFCRCNDYVVVEAIDPDQWYVQGRLADGSQPSLTATFGDPDTPPGTRYSVFILSTKAELQRGPLAQSSPIVAGATKSAPVEVTLEKP